MANQRARDAGFNFITDDQYLQDPFKIPTTEDDPVTDQGIVNTDAFVSSQNAGGGGENFNAVTDFSYSPYIPENNSANTFQLGEQFKSGPMVDSLNEKIADQMRLQNPTNLNKYTNQEIISMNPDMFNVGEEEEEDTGFFSNMFGKGKNAAMTSLGLSAIMPPQLSLPLGILKGFASKSSGPKSLQSRYTVDNAGYGNTGMRDEYGLFTGQRNDGFLGIFGDPIGTDYTGRMAERLDELEDFYNTKDIQEKYGLGNINLETDVIDEATYNQLKKVNSTYAKQVLDYQKRLRKEAEKAGVSTQDMINNNKIAETNKISKKEAKRIQDAIVEERGGGDSAPGGSRGDYGNPGGSSGEMTKDNAGTYCFDPSTPIQMTDGSTKQIKNIQLGDDTKGGEVTGVFQFKATDEIHDYKGVTVAGSHYVKEDGKFIMVKDSPLAVKIDKIPVVYSLDTTGRRIFINDIEFADYNGDGVAKNFLSNAGVDLSGFDKEVLRQVENRLI